MKLQKIADKIHNIYQDFSFDYEGIYEIVAGSRLWILSIYGRYLTDHDIREITSYIVGKS